MSRVIRIDAAQLSMESRANIEIDPDLPLTLETVLLAQTAAAECACFYHLSAALEMHKNPGYRPAAVTAVRVRRAERDHLGRAGRGVTITMVTSTGRVFDGEALIPDRPIARQRPSLRLIDGGQCAAAETVDNRQ